MSVEHIGRGLATVVLRHRWKTILASILTFLVLVLGLTRATFSTDYRVFFSEEDPLLQELETLEKVFTKTDNIVFVVQSNHGDAFDREMLAVVQNITERSWALPFASRVDSLTNFQHSFSEDGDIVVSDLVPDPAQELSAEELKRIRKAATQNVLLRGGLLSDDTRTTGINVTLRLPRKSPNEVSEAVAAARAIASEIRQEHPKIVLKLSGMALMNDAFLESSVEDMSSIIPLMYVVMIVAMSVLLRSMMATAAVVFIVIFSSGASLGVSGWFGYPLTPPSASAPTVVLTLAVADSVHIFMSMRHAMRRGVAKEDAIVGSLGSNLRPIMLTSLTTMVGFLALNFAEAPPYWHLANMTAVGIAAAFAYSITLLPAMLSLLPIKIRKQRSQGEFGYARGMDRLASFVIRFRTGVLALSAGLAVLFGGLALQLESNDQFVEYFDDSIAFRPDTEFMMENLSGIYTIDYQVKSEGPSGIAEPEYLRHLDAFSQWLRAQSEVSHVFSVSDIIKQIGQSLNENDPKYAVIPDSREAASQYLMLFEMSLPFGLDLNDRIDISKHSTRVTATVKDLSSREVREFKSRTEQWLQTNAPTSMWAKAVAPVVIFSHLSERNADSMMKGNALSLVLISLCLVMALGSVALGLISIIPNILPIVFGYGLWSLIFGEMNVVASVAGTVCLGIIVDDTIHVLSRYQLARKENAGDAELAIRRTLGAVGPALVVTTLVILLGFGVLMRSGFQMNSHLGLLVVMVVSFALIADLFMLPALLLLLHDRRGTMAKVELSSRRSKATGSVARWRSARFQSSVSGLCTAVNSAVVGVAAAQEHQEETARVDAGESQGTQTYGEYLEH